MTVRLRSPPLVLWISTDLCTIRVADTNRKNTRVGRTNRLTLLRRLRKELGWLILDGLTVALRATQVSSLMLDDVFKMLKNFAALGATILVGRHQRLQ